MADLSAVVAHASAARVATGNGTAVRVPKRSGDLAVFLSVTVATSDTTPSLTLSVEWSQDGTTFAAADPADAFTAVTTVTNAVKRFTAKGEWFRVVYTISGVNPSITFSATAYGV